MRFNFKNAILGRLAALAARRGATMAKAADVAADTTMAFPTDAVRQQFNALLDDLRYWLGHQVFGSPLLAIGTTTSKVKSVTNTIFFSVDGDLKSKAPTDDEWTLGVAGSNTIVAVGNKQRYLLLRDAAGAATVLECTQAATDAAIVHPRPPTGKTIIGVLKIDNATNPFIPGTTLLGAAGVTATFINGAPTDVLQAAKVRP